MQVQTAPSINLSASFTFNDAKILSIPSSVIAYKLEDHAPVSPSIASLFWLESNFEYLI